MQCLGVFIDFIQEYLVWKWASLYNNGKAYQVQYEPETKITNLSQIWTEVGW